VGLEMSGGVSILQALALNHYHRISSFGWIKSLL